jgi:hypothetical protein
VSDIALGAVLTGSFTLLGYVIGDVLRGIRDEKLYRRSGARERCERLTALYAEGLEVLERQLFLRQGEPKQLRDKGIELGARFRLLAPEKTADLFAGIRGFVADKFFELRDWSYTPAEGMPILKGDAATKLFDETVPLMSDLRKIMKSDLDACSGEAGLDCKWR